MKMKTEERELDKIYKRRDRYEIPDWQRDEVWDPPLKQLLIDSILRGWKLPKFYFVKTSESPLSYDVVDGQQRLSAIFEFLSGELSLSDETAATFGGFKYNDLNQETTDLIDDFKISYDVIEDATDKELMDFFQRLQSGIQLNASEKLNAIPSKLKSFCKKLSSHEFFKKKVAFNDKRYAHFDVMTKAATIEVEGVEAGLRYEDVRAVFESQAGFSDKSAVAKRLSAALEFLNSATPVGSKTFRNRSITQSMITLICALISQDVLKGKETMFGEFATRFAEDLAKEVEKGNNATDQDLIAFQRSINANVKSGARTRHRVLLRKLFQFDPGLLDIASADAALAADFGKEIGQCAKSIQALVAKINEAHSATAGSDLFKPTNKTVPAMTGLETETKDLTAFKALIENLYFLLWEGPGAKLTAKPISFVDVNTLRTDMQHDVDHGGAGAYKKKKLANATAFEKYAGLKTPSLAPPERFPLAQLALLRAVEVDLKALLKSYE